MLQGAIDEVIEKKESTDQYASNEFEKVPEIGINSGDIRKIDEKSEDQERSKG